MGAYYGVLERDDVVQEALARAWVKRGQFDPRRGTARAWLAAIVVDQVRKARRVKVPEPGDVPETPVVVGGVEEQLDLWEALACLTERQRLAVDCVYFVDLSVAETAQVMGCGVGTVKSTLADARAKLRVRLEVSDG
ncbi:RNA polymerase sigma factor [Actinokineospora auranticolor]|uniref:RNA polymerase sigma factor n=1 Tax=Actinokineospora auranticolor TaxID=155976 RepID=UPI001C67E93D|nr:RNA polymerase sigma factor [Actinokineospora auranticolor]